MTGTPAAQSGETGQPTPSGDVPSWWSVFFAGGYSWQWSTRPRLYFPPNLEYEATPSPFTLIDGLGREKTFDKPFDCYLNPFNGKVEALYVQAPESICRVSASRPNATWKRTPIRNAAPVALRIANLPFRLIPAGRRADASNYTSQDWLTVVVMWIPTLVAFLFFSWVIAMFTPEPPAGKDKSKYLPQLYKGIRYPRLARNMLENREPVAQRLLTYASWNTEAALSTYRTFRPRFLNYLVEVEHDGRKTYACERRPVGFDDITPFVMVAYSSAHYRIPNESGPGSSGDDSSGDLEALLAIATKAAVKYFSPLPSDLQHNPRAFWVSANCMPPDQVVNKDGDIYTVEGLEKEILATQDTYSISDIVRAAKHLIVIAGNRRRPWDDDALKVWGERVWTLPEVVLSKGDSVTVWRCGDRPLPLRPYEHHEIPKAQFPTEAWSDPLTARQLIEHYSNLHLSRLELVKIALECLMSRKFRALHPGDRVYVLMGLLRLRPPIDNTDSAFQAFARLSLPQDSDRLMERLICLLPDTPEQNWELMTDQYKASLWDIYPDTQVCGIGENDTVIVDGAKGAQIQWSEFTSVRALRSPTMKRAFLFYLVLLSPGLFFIAIIVAGLSPPKMGAGSDISSSYRYPDYSTSSDSSTPNPAYQAGVAFTVIILFLLILPAPYFLRHLHSGKFWEVEPCFFGIEGYVPLEVIEERLFGMPDKRGPRLRWSAWSSPLSRHREGPPSAERSVQYKYRDVEEDAAADVPLLPHRPSVPGGTPEIDSISAINTYPVEAIDPTTPCPTCAAAASASCPFHPTVASCREASLHSRMGEMKVFTLVDTFNMAVTLFHAVRPPTTLLIGGTEGGMKRAIACSFDICTGTLYRETVLRLPSRSVDCMERLPRVRLGLRKALLEVDVRPTRSTEGLNGLGGV